MKLTRLLTLLTSGVFLGAVPTVMGQYSSQSGQAPTVTGDQALQDRLKLASDTGVDLWESSFTLGANLTRGNSHSSLYTADLQSKGTWDGNEFLWGLSWAYGKTEGDRTHDYLLGYLQYNRLLSDRFYFGLRADGLRDSLSDLDYRLNVGPVWGYYFIKDPATSLLFEFGPQITFEEQGVESREYFSLRFAERFTHKFNDRVSLWQSLDYLPKADDWNDYTLIGELGLKIALSSKFSLKTYVREVYDNTPAAGFEEGDFSWITAISYSIGGQADGLSEAANMADLQDVKVSGDGWVASASAGLSITDGNTETEFFSADVLAVRRWMQNELFLGVGGVYGETTTDAGTSTTADYIFGEAQYNRLINDFVFFGIHADYYHDGLADLDYRWTIAPTLGAYLVKNDRTNFSIEAGPAYVYEKQDGDLDDYAALYVQQKWSHRLNESISLWESARYLAPFSDLEDYVLRVEVGADIKLGGGFSWRTALQDVYTNNVGAGRDRNDYRLISSLAYTF